MSEELDLIVLGSGAAASSAPPLARENGWSVAVIDSRPFGGTCALRGCDPKKILVGAAEITDRARRMEGKGMDAGAADLDWPTLMAFKRGFTEPVPDQREAALREMGVETIHGRARFVGEREIEVEGSRLEARKFLIATGARPATLDIPGEDLLVTSEGFLELDDLPRRIVFVGGGYIAFEFAHLAARAGAEITVLDVVERPLQGFDPDLVDRLVGVSQEIGIDLRMRHGVASIRRSGDGFVVLAETAGEEVEIPADLVVHAAGRTPEIDDLDLPAGGIERGKRGVKVDQHFRSISSEHVFAAGDAAETDGLPLTPVAGREGSAAARNLILGEQNTIDYAGLCTVVFSLPPLASVGMGEEEARQSGIDVRVVHRETTDWYSARHIAARAAAHKVLIENGSGRILGAHLLGDAAPETINLFALAIRHGLSAEDLGDGLYAYPTHASDLPYMVQG